MGRWKNGPEFLKLPEEEWPNESSTNSIPEEVDQLERRKVQPVLHVTESLEVLPCKKFSSWRKLIRVTAYVLRFISKLRSKHQTKESEQRISVKDTTEDKPISAKVKDAKAK